jgi:hypothetical protein
MLVTRGGYTRYKFGISSGTSSKGKSGWPDTLNVFGKLFGPSHLTVSWLVLQQVIAYFWNGFGERLVGESSRSTDQNPSLKGHCLYLR